MKQQPQLSEEALLESMRQGDQGALKVIYETNYPMVLKLITTNNGTEDEARDIYQEAVIVLYEKVKAGGFKLTSKIGTFLYSVARQLWLKELAFKRRNTDLQENDNHDDVVDMVDEHDEKGRRLMIIERCLDLLGEPCKSILVGFFYRNLTMEEIAEEMGYTNAANAKNQKYKCFNRFKKLVIVNERELDHE